MTDGSKEVYEESICWRGVRVEIEGQIPSHRALHGACGVTLTR